ncbi:hypothetical protein HN51_035003 [Arachis hypogaea]|uniref:Proteinase inhibitor type-2 CEVI57 n=1 Tax=Arachis hypogaea TaxID=3818 RepID=A0A445A6L7_ARAHY|nr:proteinase inhibitor PSI-1.2 [Arachis ipaensis]XP_025641070.1 proteinase inhibitor PSI-1.2 [Arachis hypogaea]QHN99936.1 Proteinase inhibitor type-2 [Arachis hypogaea]RYR21992.1 hypothetical protein Ahy_B03g067287 [Arachis hypogaea]
MAFNKVGVIFLVMVICGMIILEGEVKRVEGCEQVCYEAAYMTCPSSASGEEHLSPACNCCLAPRGCTLYNSDGSTICTAN